MSRQQIKSFSTVDKFIEEQIQNLRCPLHLTKEITDQINATNTNIVTSSRKAQHKKLKLEDTPRILNKINTKLRRYLHDYFSKQSVAQLLDQVRILRENNVQKRVATLRSLEDLQLQFIDMDINNLSLQTLLEKIDELPTIVADKDTTHDGTTVQKYNDLVANLQFKSTELNTIQQQRINIKKNTEILNERLIGDLSFKENLVKNIPTKSGSSEINIEVKKLKILLEKLINDVNTNPEKKQLIIKYLNLTQEELDELLVLQ